jgi:hypothetical protein
MSLRDSTTRPAGWTWRARWRAGWRLAWRGLRRAGAARPAALRCGRWRTRRLLREIEGPLAADTPALASMFEMFNQLTAGERAAGVERLPGPGLLARTSRGEAGRQQPAYIAVLLALAAIATLCLTLSLRVHSATRPCRVAASAQANSYAPVRDLTCQSYATNK